MSTEPLVAARRRSPPAARALLPVAALAIIISAGAIQGLWSGRWRSTEAFDARLAAMHRLPMKIGEWTGHDIVPEEHVFERAGVAGGLMRRYEDGRGGLVTILLVCGRPGPTSVHTPEVCYAGAGYEAVTPRVLVPVPASPGEPHASTASFWNTDFRKQDSVTPDYLRIFYAWSVDGIPRASNNPRLDFAGSPALYKLYVIRPMSHPGGDPAHDPTTAFIRQLQPEFQKSIHPAA